MDRYELPVEGMHCASCVERVSHAAKQVDGVHRVEADHEGTVVEVTADEGTEAAVRQAIRAAGYDVPS